MLLGSPKFLFNQIVNEDFESERNDKIPFLLTPPQKKHRWAASQDTAHWHQLSIVAVACLNCFANLYYLWR